MKVWSPAELASIEGNRNEALFRLLAMTGMRRSEVVDVPKTRRSRRTGHTVTAGQSCSPVEPGLRSRR